MKPQIKPTSRKFGIRAILPDLNVFGAKQFVTICALLLLPIVSPFWLWSQNLSSLPGTELPDQPGAVEVFEALSGTLHANYSPAIRHKKEPKAPIYDLLDFPMGNKWGMPTTKIPLSIKFKSSFVIDSVTNAHVVGVRDYVHRELKTDYEEAIMIFREGSLSMVIVPMTPDRLLDRLWINLGEPERKFRQGNSEYFEWTRGNTGIAAKNAHDSGYIWIFPVTPPQN